MSKEEPQQLDSSTNVTQTARQKTKKSSFRRATILEREVVEFAVKADLGVNEIWPQCNICR